VPGRLNETWFKANRIGVYYGNCRELCGIDHAFMPIEVRVVSQADFDAWVATKGGSVAGAAPAAAVAAPAATDAAVPTAAAAPAVAPATAAPAVATPPAPSAPAAK
jgi:cytochrome c oxidase subunit 2